MKSTPKNFSELWPQAGDFLEPLLRELPGYLLKQRWYPAKNAGPARVTLQTLRPLEVAGLTAALAVWHASVDGVQDIDFFLPVAVRPCPTGAEQLIPRIAAMPDGSVVIDALDDDSFVHALVALIAAQAPPDDSTLLEAGHTNELTAISPTGEERIHRSQVEQSNTSIRVGDHMILKIIRKTTLGVHPELEMGRFLTEQAHFKSAAQLLGWLQLAGATVALIQAFIPNEGDGWTWIQSYLRAQDSDLAATRSWIRQLGVRTAEMHVAMTATTNDGAFTAETAQPSDWQRWTHGVEGMATRVVNALSNNSDLNDASKTIARHFEQRLPEILEFCDRLRSDSAPVTTTRHHGDYHLGQVLVTAGSDVIIVDFEGEPSRDLHERRAKHIALRDVAGMLRSFFYAKAVAEKELGHADEPMRHQAQETERLREWLISASRIYLDAYFGTVGPGFNGLDDVQARDLIRFFSLEKALYEVLYELANRPTWAWIPLESILELLDK